jgi:hypothetical protein
LGGASSRGLAPGPAIETHQGWDVRHALVAADATFGAVDCEHRRLWPLGSRAPAIHAHGRTAVSTARAISMVWPPGAHCLDAPDCPAVISTKTCSLKRSPVRHTGTFSRFATPILNRFDVVLLRSVSANRSPLTQVRTGPGCLPPRALSFAQRAGHTPIVNHAGCSVCSLCGGNRSADKEGPRLHGPGLFLFIQPVPWYLLPRRQRELADHAGGGDAITLATIRAEITRPSGRGAGWWMSRETVHRAADHRRGNRAMNVLMSFVKHCGHG